MKSFQRNVLVLLVCLIAGGGLTACWDLSKPAEETGGAVRDDGRKDVIVISNLPGDAVEEGNSSVEQKVYDLVEEMPSFPGGEEELKRYISDHLRYPVKAGEKEITGRVVVRFTVMSDGSIGDVRIVRSLDPHLDKEVMRLVVEMPRWIPGRHGGETVNVWMTLPVDF